MDSPPGQRLPNELIDKIFKSADPDDKALCAAICRTNKAGMRAMYGINETGESVGSSVMYHTVGITNPSYLDGEWCRRLEALMCTLLDRPDLLDQIVELRHHVGGESQCSGIELPKFRAKLGSMGLANDFILEAAVPPHFLGLLLICKNITSVEIMGQLHDVIEISHLERISQTLAYRRSRDSTSVGKCGLDSIQHLTLRHTATGSAFELDGPYLWLPELRSLTIHNITALSGEYSTPHNQVEHINFIGSKIPLREIELFLMYYPSVRTLNVEWPPGADMTAFHACAWNLLGKHLGIWNHSLTEISFTTAKTDSAPAPSLPAGNDSLRDDHVEHSFNATSIVNPPDDSDPWRDMPMSCLGPIKALSLRKLTLPKVACIGWGFYTVSASGSPLGNCYNGVDQNFADFLQHVLPDDVSQLDFEIISPNLQLSEQDKGLLAHASHKNFKSFTIYNCTRDSWVSQAEQRPQDQAAADDATVLHEEEEANKAFEQIGMAG